VVTRKAQQPVSISESPIDALEHRIVTTIGPSETPSIEVNLLQMRVIDGVAKHTHETTVQPTIALIGSLAYEVKITTNQPGA